MRSPGRLLPPHPWRPCSLAVSTPAGLPVGGFAYWLLCALAAFVIGGSGAFPPWRAPADLAPVLARTGAVSRALRISQRPGKPHLGPGGGPLPSRSFPKTPLFFPKARPSPWAAAPLTAARNRAKDCAEVPFSETLRFLQHLACRPLIGRLSYCVLFPLFRYCPRLLRT